MRLEDLAKLKAALPKKRNAQATQAVPKRTKTAGVGPKDALVKQASKAGVKAILVTSTQPPLLALGTLSSSTPTSAPQPAPSNIPSGLALVEGLADSEGPLANILGDVTFRDWRVIKEFIERTLLPIELERIKVMGSYSLRKAFVTIMHQVFFLPVLVPFHPFLFLLSFFLTLGHDVAYTIPYCFDKSINHQ